MLTAYELDEHETALLVEAVRTVDLLDELDGIVKAEGAVIDSPQGRKAHPAAVEARQQRITLARLLAALRLPAGEDGDQQATARPQRRAGVRGVYAVKIRSEAPRATGAAGAVRRCACRAGRGPDDRGVGHGRT